MKFLTILFYLLVLIAMFLGITNWYLTSTEDTPIEELLFVANPNLTGQEPDYTEEYFIAIEIGNKTKFNFLTCLDGVLEITNTTIACVKESGEE